MSPQRSTEMGIVRKRLHDEFGVFRKNLRYVPSNSGYFTLLDKRFEQVVLRGYFVDLICRYIEQENDKSIELSGEIKEEVLPFLSELMIAVMYYDNQILDGKAGVDSHYPICHNLLQSHLLQSEISNYLDVRVSDRDIRDKMSALVRDVFAAVNIGQEIEENFNHFQNWKQSHVANINYPFLPVDWEAIAVVESIVAEESIQMDKRAMKIVRNYFTRTYLTNSYLFVRFTEFLCDFAPTANCKQGLLKFAGFYGMMCQLVNDVCDFVPSESNPGTKTKLNTDALSDLKNRNITLPIQIHLLKEQRGSVEKYLNSNQKCLGEKQEMAIVVEMLKSEALDAAISIAKEIKRRSLREINESNPEFTMIKDLVSVADANVFYKHLGRIRKEIFSKKKLSKKIKSIFNEQSTIINRLSRKQVATAAA